MSNEWILERLAALTARVDALEAKEKPAPKGRASAMTDSWQPRTEDIEWARKGYPNVNEGTERDRFRDYWQSRGDTRKDWNAGYRNWIRKAAEFSPASVTVLPGRPATRGSAITEANRQRRDRVADKLAALWGD